MKCTSISRYGGLLAEIYDVEQNFTDDIEYYLRMASRFGDPILELGAGTGRLLIPLAKKGYQVVGLEKSPSMVDIFLRKIDSLEDRIQKRISVIEGDMSEFNLDKKFSFIFMAYNTLNHLRRDQVLECFRCVKKHLAPHGVFMLNNDIPSLEDMKGSSGKTVRYEHYHPYRESVVETTFTSHYDLENLEEKDVIVVKEIEENRVVRQEVCKQRLSIFFPCHVRNYLQDSGMKIISEYGCLSEEPLGPDSREMVFLAR